MAKNAEARKVPKERLEDIFRMFTTTLISMQPSEQAHLAESYDAEMTRQSQIGRVPPGQGTHAIAPKHVADLTARVLSLVRRQHWGRNAFYLNTFRGMRSANVSTLDDLPHSPEDIILNRYEIKVLPLRIDWKTWYFDIGLELMLDSHVLMFRRDSLAMMLQKLLHIGEADAEAIVHTSKFEWDSAAQLFDAGGFRYEPPKNEQDACGVTYLQAYCTEKHQIYSLGKDKNSALINFKDVMENGAAKYTKDLISAWSDMALASSSWNARVEIRLRGDKLHLSERLEFRTEDTIRCLFMFPTPAWFRFKCIRLYALGDIVWFWFTCEDNVTKSHADSLHLLMASIWSINALNSRPSDWASDRALSDAVCPHRLDRTDNIWVPVHDHQGLHFLAGLNYRCNTNDGVGYLSGRTLDMGVLQSLAGHNYSLTDLKRTMLKRPSANTPKSQPVAKRSNTGANKTKPVKLTAVPEGFVNPFNLDEEDFDMDNDTTFKDRLALLLCQFQFDIMFKFPIHKNTPTYERVDRNKLVQELWPKAMSRVNVADVFQLCAFAQASDDRWTRCFNMFFPDNKYTFDLASQNWKEFNFAPLWTAHKASMNTRQWKAFRKELLRVWHESIAWAPLPGIDRAWTTKKNDRGQGVTARSDDGEWTGACPIIVLNPRFQGSRYDARTVTDPDDW
jgi:hypothetical protein